MRSGKLPQLPESLREQQIENAYRSEARVNKDDIHSDNGHWPYIFVQFRVQGVGRELYK